MAIDKSERYLKEIAKNTAEIAKELKRMNRKSQYNSTGVVKGGLDRKPM